MIWHQRGEKGELIHCVGISMSQFPWLYYKLTYLFSILMGSPQMIVMNGSPCQQSLSRLDVYNCPCLWPWRILSDICLWPSTAAIVVDNPTVLVIPACILHTKCIPAIKYPSYEMTWQYSCFFVLIASWKHIFFAITVALWWTKQEMGLSILPHLMK